MGLRYDEPRYVPWGYGDGGFEILYYKCLDAANALDRLKSRLGSTPELQAIIDNLRDMEAFQIEVCQQTGVPLRRLSWPKVNEDALGGDDDALNEDYFPAPIDEDYVAPFEEDEANTLRDSSSRSDNSSSSQVLHTPCASGPSSSMLVPYNPSSSYAGGPSSSTLMPFTPPDIIPQYVPGKISQDVPPYQVETVSRL